MEAVAVSSSHWYPTVSALIVDELVMGNVGGADISREIFIVVGIWTPTFFVTNYQANHCLI